MNWANILMLKKVQVIYETLGQGKPVLLLPAFSTVSSRSEMGGIAQILATQYQVTVLDWLGLGESQCPPVDYNPALFHQLLQDFITSRFDGSLILLAAGHTAGYALKFAQNNPELVDKRIIINT